MRYLLRKLAEGRIWRRIALERLTEPLHLNFASLAVAGFGSFRAKVAFDLIVRQQHAFGLLAAADCAREVGATRLTAVEFGVAAGAGLLNLCEIAARVERETGVAFDIVGFDSGCGLPPPRDWRDHPEIYSHGDFALPDAKALTERLPKNARVVFGDVTETVPDFLDEICAPIGFVSFDLDYYWSTRDALTLFQGDASQYLPKVPCYFDDVWKDWHNSFAGELLAISEFNRLREERKIVPYNLLRNERVFTRARWIDCMFLMHVFDHPYRVASIGKRSGRFLGNPYLDGR
jgi:hypothetical protein